MKLRIALIIVLIVVAAPVQAQLPAWVTAHAVNEVFAISNTQLSSVVPSPVPPGDAGPSAKITAWNGGALKRQGSCYMLGAAGGDSDYTGNEVDQLCLNTTTPAWQQITAPSDPTKLYAGGAQFNADLTPSDTHTYWGTQFLDSLNHLYVMPSPGFLGCCGIPTAPGGWYPGTSASYAFSYNYASKAWDLPTAANYFAQYFGGGDFTGAITMKNPWTDEVYMTRSGSNGFYKYRPLSNTWTNITPGTPNSQYIGSVWDPKRNYILLVGAGFSCVDINPSGTAIQIVNSTFTAQVHGPTDFGGLGSAPFTRIGNNTGCSGGYPGVLYDEVKDGYWVFVGDALAGGGGDTTTSVYYIDAATLTVSQPTLTGAVPMAARTNGVLNSAQYVPELGGIMFNNSYASNVLFMRTSLVGVASPKTTLTLNTTVSAGLSQYSAGVEFKKGDIPGGSCGTQIPNSQCIVKRLWNDGSTKMAIVSGEMALSTSAPTTITIYDQDFPKGTNLTSTDIQAAAPSASVALTGFGTVNLSGLLASPFRTWISGPEMVECHYRSPIGSDPTLVAWFQVRLWKSGKMWVRAIVENGYWDPAQTLTVDKTAVTTVTIGGVTVFNNGGSAFTTYRYTRWMAEGWIGTSDPQVTSFEDLTYLDNTKLVPNYNWRNPSNTALNSLTQTYVPNGRGDLTPDFPNSGYQAQLGLIPHWDALYATSGDSRAYNSSKANCFSLNSYPIVWNNSATGLVMKPSEAGTNDIGEGTNTLGPVNGNEWDVNHNTGACYLTYLATGDYLAYETLLQNMGTIYLATSGSKGSSTSRILWAETRGTAWSIRTMSQVSAIFPTGDAIATEFQTLLANNMTYWDANVTTLQGLGVSTGYIWEYNGGAYGINGGVGDFMHWFWVQTDGFGSDIEPLSNMTTFNAVRDFMYHIPVGLLGPDSTSNFCYNYAASYNVVIGTSGSSPMDITTFYPNWHTIWTNTQADSHAPIPDPSFAFGVLNQDGSVAGATQCSTSLQGYSAANPGDGPGSFWGNFMPAIAYAVDHGATGASAAYSRLTGASNYSTLSSVGFDDVPEWGITPRSLNPTCTSESKLAFTLQPSNASLGASLGTVNVSVQDSSGTLCSAATDSITLSKDSGATWGNLQSGSSLTKSASAGVASWNDLSIISSTGSGSIDAAASGLAGAVSNSITISNSVQNNTLGKQAPSNANTSSSMAYTIKMGNGGTGTSSTTLTVLDQLPAGVVATNCSVGTGVSTVSCGSLPSVPGALLTITVGLTSGMAPGSPNGTAVITITATSPSSTGTIINYASVDSTGGTSPPTPGPSCNTANCGNASTVVSSPSQTHATRIQIRRKP